MLAEGFLRVLRYREERKFAQTKSKIQSSDADRAEEGHYSKTAAEPSGTGVLHEAPDPLRPPPGLLIPGRPVSANPDPIVLDFSLNCSLLEHYPDLQVADSGPLPAPRPSSSQPVSPAISVPTQPDLTPDQGYLVMGGSVNISVDIPEPRTNSMLNGMLERKLEEVYLQHLTENLARCNSNLGHSLLHGLVPPPQPSSRAPDSLMVGIEERSTYGRDKTISYLNTNNDVTCSSNFSSPMLRISESQDGI